MIKIKAIIINEFLNKINYKSHLNNNKSLQNRLKQIIMPKKFFKIKFYFLVIYFSLKTNFKIHKENFLQLHE